jgi:hypothetical protein
VIRQIREGLWEAEGVSVNGGPDVELRQERIIATFLVRLLDRFLVL